ncbi:hypothetical protein V1525DRAFT_394021 [Lipomyces kononenkoae]|uniref:Uncharacterized protein n=1 Tax=Lipomyces kononenkoae TaxID=34357 RepID=A0ACC3TB98_LIPKO
MASVTWRRSSTSSISSSSPACYTRSSSFSTYSPPSALDEPLYGPPSPFSFPRPSSMSLPVSPSASRPASPRSPSVAGNSSTLRRESASASLSAFARLNLGRRASGAERADIAELTRLISSEGNYDSQNSEEISRIVRQVLEFSAIRTERGNKFSDRRRRSASQAVDQPTDELPVGFKNGWGWRLSNYGPTSVSRERSQSRSASRTRPITRRNARCCCGSGSCSSERERYGSLRCRQRSLSPTSM